MSDLKLDKIIELLGDYKKQGNEYLFQCPYCNDKSRNNFSYNKKKNLLWCFASNGEHSKKWLKDVYNKSSNSNFNSKGHFEEISKVTKKSNITIEKLEQNYKNALYHNNTLLNSTKYLDIIRSKRGLSVKTIKDCLIGVSTKRNCFVFPSVKYNPTNLISTNFNQCKIGRFNIRNKSKKSDFTCLL